MATNYFQYLPKEIVEMTFSLAQPDTLYRLIYRDVDYNSSNIGIFYTLDDALLAMLSFLHSDGFRRHIYRPEINTWQYMITQKEWIHPYDLLIEEVPAGCVIRPCRDISGAADYPHEKCHYTIIQGHVIKYDGDLHRRAYGDYDGLRKGHHLNNDYGQQVAFVDWKFEYKPKKEYVQEAIKNFDWTYHIRLGEY